jgi:tetratricopeptide (TPR) repeat protein
VAPTDADIERAHRRTRAAQAFAAIFFALTGAAFASRLPATIVVIAACLALAGLVAAYLSILDEQSRSDALLNLGRLLALRTTVPGIRDEVPLLTELSPYDLGADHPAVRPQMRTDLDPYTYLEREADADIREAVHRAIDGQTPVMVVLHGPSKAGKSRTLYEALRNDDRVAGAAVLVPRDADALGMLLQPDGLPYIEASLALLWLDDLEQFVRPSLKGMSTQTLDIIASWNMKVLIVATAGGRGADALATSGLYVPIDEIYNDERVFRIPLDRELQAVERAHVEAMYAPASAESILRHGVGEFLVAALALAQKLDEQRHKSGAQTSPEGAALAWAVIDWTRLGMPEAITEDQLWELSQHYLRGRVTRDRFDSGLDWALEPVYGSIALVESASDGYRAYDWIVAYTRKRKRLVAPEVLDIVLRYADSESAFSLGVAAYSQGDVEKAIRAFGLAEQSRHRTTNVFAAYNLAVLFERQGDPERAIAAYQRVSTAKYVSLSQRAETRLLSLMAAQKKKEGWSRGTAVLALLDSLDEAARREKDVVARYCNMATAGEAIPTELALEAARLLHKDGDTDSASGAYRSVIDSRHEDLAPQAALELGSLLIATAASDDGIEALEVAINFGHPTASPAAALRLGRFFEHCGRTLDALRQYETASTAADVTTASEAALLMAGLLRRSGNKVEAQSKYRGVIDLHHETNSPVAAFELGLMLKDAGEQKAAAEALEYAAASGMKSVAPWAAFNLGLMLEDAGNVSGARRRYQQAVELGHPAGDNLYPREPGGS